MVFTKFLMKNTECFLFCILRISYCDKNIVFQSSVVSSSDNTGNKIIKTSIPVHDSHSKVLSNHKIGCNVLICYDYRTKQPKYVHEKFSKPSNNDNKNHNTIKLNRKGMSFYADPTVDVDYFKIRPKDYTDSKYDRGHMIPAADMAHDLDFYSFTFSMLNISPQNSELNKFYWAKFEAWLRYLYEKGSYEEFEVISGPIFAPLYVNNRWIYSNETIGSYPRLISVPTHFFKVIRGTKYVPIKSKEQKNTNDTNINDNNQSLQQIVIGCFLIPNHSINTEVPISSFLIRLDTLETIAGLRFYDNTLSEVERAKVEKLLPSLSESELAKLLWDTSKYSISHQTQSNTNTNVNSDSTKNTSNDKAIVTSDSYNYGNRNTKITISSSSDYSPILHLCQSTECYKPFFQK